MPDFIGSGPGFYLVTCKLLPPPDVSKQDKEKFHRENCSRCGYFKDTQKRAKKAMKKGEEPDKLVCIHPENKTGLNKWKQQLNG